VSAIRRLPPLEALLFVPAKAGAHFSTIGWRHGGSPLSGDDKIEEATKSVELQNWGTSVLQISGYVIGKKRKVQGFERKISPALREDQGISTAAGGP
jgi:hypothetical protein